jgi:MATE family multidrug resistance protein
MVRTTGRIGIGFGGAMMLSFGLLFWLSPHLIIGLFLDLHDPKFAEVVTLAVKLLAIAAWFELFDGVQSIAMGAIRGLKDAKTTFLIGLGCYWLISAPAAWLLGFSADMGAAGVWWGLALGLCCAAVALTLAFEYKAARLLNKPSVGGALLD